MKSSIMSLYWMILCIGMLAASQAYAACVVIDVSGLSATQRSKLGAAVALIQADSALQWQNAGGALVSLQSQATQVNACAVSTTGITLANIQTQLTALATAQAAQDTAAADLAALKTAANTEITGNNLCTQASLAAIDSVIDASAASIQADIDATTNIVTAKAALTTMKTIMAVAFKKVARCLLAYRQTQ